jgi:hypothetical protein
MPKKSRRTKAKRRAAVARVVEEARSQESRRVPSDVQPVQSPPRVSPKVQDLASRYQYVMPEVKRIGIIAGSIIVVLIILSFALG